ncbi:MAG TPA: guanylate kinase [Terriglobales bacterium]|jgi:guanylate kinase|nr:guanylate kinase [Terriglobales bacterium]
MVNVFIISAPSGSGKSTLVSMIRRSVPQLEFSISYTTRKPRGAEQNGREYFFVSREEFRQMIREDQFLEYAVVFETDYYGTACRFLDQAKNQGKDLLLDIDVQGAAQVKKKVREAVSIFILPPNRSELEQRLRSRGQDTEEKIQRRLEEARREIENYDKYDYILVNDHLDDSVKALEAILLSERQKRAGNPDVNLSALAETCRLENVRDRLDPILQSFREVAAGGK